MKVKTLEERLKLQSNDYFLVEKEFFNLTGQRLINENNYKFIKNIKLKTLSIIIPYYNSEKSILYTLNSIQKQKNINFRNIEILIIDDGSSKKIQVKKDYNFKIKIIRLDKNKGRVRVRNIGMLMANNDIIMFLDADIILHEMVLYNHLLVHSILNKNNLLLVGYREWVKKQDQRILKNKLSIKDIDLSFDHRIKITFSKRHLPYISNKKLLGKTIYIAEDTNYYKKFGNYKSFFGFKLYQQVHGFLFSLPRDLIEKSGPVGETKKGWGSDDVMLIARFIASGGRIIPLLNSTALHLFDINGNLNEKQKIAEREINLKRFKQQLKEPFVEFIK